MIKKITASEIDNWTPPYEKAPEKSRETSTSVIHLSELFDNVIKARFPDSASIQGYPTTCWPVFNDAFGGLRPGEVTVITAETGTGKSTFALNWALDYAKPGGNGVFCVSPEMSKQAIAEIIAQLIHKKPVPYFDHNTDLTDLIAVKEIFKHLNFWFFDHYGRLNIDFLIKAIWYAVCEKKTRLIVVDHLGYLVRRENAETQALAIGNTMRDLVTAARQLNATILLIVHPAKLYTHGKKRPVEVDDLKGSSDIKQEAANVFSLYKPNRATPETFLYFLKIRSHHFSKSVGGKIRFDFDPQSLCLKELSSTLEFKA